MRITISSDVELISSVSTFLMSLWSFSLILLPSLMGTSNLIFISALSMGKVPDDCNSLMTSSACCLAFFVGLIEKCASFIDCSIMVTVYGRFVSGLTHLSDTIVAISLNRLSKCWCRSLSDTWSSPFSKIFYKIIRLLSMISLEK